MDNPDLHLESVPLLIKQFKCQEIAEVGVEEANLARWVLRECGSQLKSYYLIDPWRPFASASDYFKQEKFQHIELWDSFCLGAYKIFKNVPNVRVLRLPSPLAAELFDPQSLDFVYIDANHSYQAVLQDIQAWLPIVRTRGVLAGHDFGELHLGVAKAVCEIFPESLVQLRPGCVWFVEKRELRACSRLSCHSRLRKLSTFGFVMTGIRLGWKLLRRRGLK